MDSTNVVVVTEEKRKPESIQFLYAKQLKEAVKNIPDNALIICQVTAKDGQVWNLNGEIIPNMNPDDTQNKIAVISLSHPQVKSLPAMR